MNIKEKLVAIQTELKAPKNQYNSFGKYKYRSAEDILEAIKPFETKYKVAVVIRDSILEAGSHVYIETVAALFDCEGKDSLETKAQAIIDFQAKGMQMPQRTGAASSYAKKYALGNLFLLDDTKDSDATNSHGKAPQKASKTEKAWLNKDTDTFKKAQAAIKGGKATIEQVKAKYNVSKEVEQLLNK